MTDEEIRMIRKSLEAAAGEPLTLALLFYRRLFRLDPSLRMMFRTDLIVQAKKLMDVLTPLIASLERFDALRPTLQQMGARHVEYGVRPEHYTTVAEALLVTLEEVAGPKFDAEVKAAWTKLLAR